MFNRIPALEAAAELQPSMTLVFPKMTMTVDEMAEELNISRPTAYELVKQEGYPSFRLGQRIIVNRAGLQRWIDAQCDPLPAA